MKIFQLSNINVLFSLEKPFLYPKNCQTFFLINLAEESEGKETSNFWPKSWTNPFAKNANFSTSKYQLICRLEKDFCVRNVSEHSFWTIWTRKSKVSKLQIFDPKYELLCKKWKFCNFLISLFFQSGKAYFLSRTLPNTLYDEIGREKWR